MVTYTCQLCNQYSTTRLPHFNNHILTCVGTCSNSTNVIQNIDQVTNDNNHHEILYSDHENSINDDELEYHDIDEFIMDNDHAEIVSDYDSNYSTHSSIEETVTSNHSTTTSNHSTTNEESSESHDKILNELESASLKFFIDNSLPISSFDGFVALFSLAENKNLSFLYKAPPCQSKRVSYE